MISADMFLLDLTAVCRICLQKSDAQLVPIFDREEKGSGVGVCVSLSEKIENCSGIKIINDRDLPSRICLKCRAFLTLAHKFRQICRRSDDFLREFVCKQLSLQHSSAEQADVHYDQAEALVEEVEADTWSNDDHVAEIVTTSTITKAPDGQTGAMESIAPPVVVVETSAVRIPAKHHACEICGNTYPRKSTLDTHMRRHRDERPYECEICHKSFHVNYQLMRHIRQHTGARPYTCQYCQRTFSDRTAQVKHERTHRNERPYACTTCGKSFTYSSVLKMHYKTHTGEKPHACKLCNKRFARQHNLLAHLQTQQHNNDPRKDIACTPSERH